MVHRDLKPSNILVSEAGEVKLLDFGIAKLLEASMHESGVTELSGRALTPDYASPEQIAGEPIGVASDVYSLGVLLYKLLTDTQPYRLKRQSRAALEDAILAVEPVRPSEVPERRYGKRSCVAISTPSFSKHSRSGPMIVTRQWTPWPRILCVTWIDGRSSRTPTAGYIDCRNS